MLTRIASALRYLLQIANSEQDSLGLSMPTYKVKPDVEQFAHMTNLRA